MSINFTCHACGNDISMEEEWAGQRVKCPECRETVPVPGGSNESTVSESRSPQPASGSNQYESETVGSYGAVPGHKNTAVKTINTHAKTGFILGLVSIFAAWLPLIGGVIPILAIIFSSIGFGTFNLDKHHKKWMAGWGLGLGIIYLLMAIFYYPNQ